MLHFLDTNWADAPFAILYALAFTSTENLNKNIEEIIKTICEIKTNYESRSKYIEEYEKTLEILNKRYGTLYSTYDFSIILLNMGRHAIDYIIKTYYKQILTKYINQVNVYNIGSHLEKDELKTIIDTYTDKNLDNVINTYYGILQDEYEIPLLNQTPINDFLIGILDNIALTGIIQYDSLVYNNIKQYINVHMNELLSKTLDHSKLIIDVFHKWLNNYYYSLMTFETIININ